MQPTLPGELAPLVFLAGYLAAGVISAAFAAAIFRTRWSQPVARAFAVVSLTLALWAIGYVGRLLSPGLEAKLLWTQLSWVGVTVAPVAVFAFVVCFTGRGHLLSRRRLGALLVVPVLTQVLLLTNASHGLFYESVWLYTAEATPVIASRGGAWFYGIHIPYSWGLYLIATVLLVQFTFTTKHIYRSQTIALLLGAIVPWVVNGTFLAGVRLHPELDPTPVGFAVGMAIIGTAAFKLNFLGLIPVARERVVDEMDDCVFVLDDERRIVDVNDAGAAFLDAHGTGPWAIGDRTETVFPPALQDDRAEPDGGTESEIHVGDGDAAAWYLRRQRRLGEPVALGSVISLTEITVLKAQHHSLQRTRERAERERDSKESIRRLVLETSTEREIADSICRLLVDEHGYAAAWVAQRSTHGRAPADLLARFGEDGGFFEATADDAGHCDAVTSRVLETADPVTVSRTGPDADPAVPLAACGLESVHSLPLGHDGLMFGALTVVRTEPLEDGELELLTEFADALAFKRQVYRQRSALTTKTVTEIELRLTADHVLLNLAGAASIPETARFVAHELSTGDEQGTYLVEAIDVDGDAVQSAAADLDAVQDVTHLATRRDTTVFQAQFDPPTLGTVLRGYGGVSMSIIADADRVDAVVQFPRQTDVSEVVGAIRTHWPDATIRSRNDRTVDVDRPGVFETLTQKQETALRAAVVAGFFDRPQGANASEVAETLGVSRSTFLHHLRAAERMVFEDAFEPDS
ncbi:helix-turn-helix domain-containing protein [Halobacteria archaeon AArc-dxtr1]|nr:helix-turn-helix domain-containing protein [Halobacteria archaeon AArc-dxtr1]